MLSISTRRHFESDDETATTSKIYDADFPPARIRTWNSFARADTGGSFQSAGIYQSSKLLFPPFSVIVASPLPVRRRPFAVSRPPSIRSLFPPLSACLRLSSPSENMHHTNKTTQAAQRISMPFLSYRRATNEHTIHPPSAPFFSNYCVLSVGQAPPVSMLLAT